MRAKAPKTIVLIHGLWMTPRSWENWAAYCTSRGYRVLAPAYPGLEVEIGVLRDDPSPIQALTLPGIVAHFEHIVRELNNPPILIGHSFGGLLVQILLDRGLGAAGVAIASVPADGVLLVPPAQIRSVLPALSNPANRHQVVPLSATQFHYAFTNTLSAEKSAAVYGRYLIPAPASLVWGSILANPTPGCGDSYVNFANNDRAPLLFIAGGADHIMPASVNKSNAEHYRVSSALTEYKEFPGRSHYTVGEKGWEAVADYALTWADQALAASGLRGAGDGTTDEPRPSTART